MHEVQEGPAIPPPPLVHSGDESMLILQSLLCLLREKNVLSRRDIEELCRKVELGAAGELPMPVPCCSESAAAASADMRRVSSFIGQRYGGKRGPGFF